jgi:hypothetical protein
MPPRTVSTKQLSEWSGLPFRQVQNFTDAGVLVTDEGAGAPGRGGSRQYPSTEVHVATLLNGVSHKGMAVSEADGIATTIRPIVCSPENLGFKGFDEARKLSRYLNSCLSVQSLSELPENLRRGPHAFMRHVDVITELRPRWGHVEPTESNLKRIRAWMALDLAKRGEADPILFLHRRPDETWSFDLWAVLSVADAVRSEYRVGNALIEVRQVEANESSENQAGGLQFDDLLVELTTGRISQRKSLRGGYVIMPRSIYASATLNSNRPPDWY